MTFSSKKLCGAVFFLCASMVSVAAQAEEWGSISVEFKDDNMSNPAYGIGGGKTKEEAEANAQKFCEDKSCKTVISYQQCGAYAASAKHGGYGMAASKKAAQDLAVNACGSDACKIIVADCN